MDIAKKIELLRAQINATWGRDMPDDLDEWRAKTSNRLRLVLSEEHVLYKNFQALSFTPMIWSPELPDSDLEEARNGVRQGLNILRAAIDELELIDSDIDAGDATAGTPLAELPVFLVHGHDPAHRERAARTINQLTGSDPVILDEHPSSGQTIIEKLEEHGDASFAVVLLTADDRGRAKSESELQSRARQNVWFEAGVFIGRLGRRRVVLLHEPEVDIPSDLRGVVYVRLDEAGGWRSRLGAEMKAAGLKIDLNNLK